MNKVYSYDSEGFELRKEFWQKECLIELELIENDELRVDKPDSQLILLSEAVMGSLFEKFHQLPTDVSLSRSADCLVLQNGKWWPRHFWISSLHECIVKKANDLDCRSAAYITGINHRSRAAIHMVTQMGFPKIYLVVQDTDEVKSQIEALKRNYFGIEIILLPTDRLTLQPSNGSLLINTINAAESEELVKDLSYLNFLQKNSLVAESHLLPLESFLLSEAQNVGLRVVSAAEVLGHRDFQMLSTVGGKYFEKIRDLNEQQYILKWQEFLKTRPTSS